jgi:membrane-bound serine protease (ClpP class)
MSFWVCVLLSALPDAVLAFLAARGRPQGKPTTGAEGLVGQVCEVTQTVSRSGGKVFVHGEYWFARSYRELPVGTKVEIERVEGLTLFVVPSSLRVIE